MRRATRVTLGSPGLRAGKSPAFLALARAGPVRAVADEEPGVEDFQQERGERQARLVRGKAAVTVLVAAARACGKLMASGGIPAASTPAPMSWQMAW